MFNKYKKQITEFFNYRKQYDNEFTYNRAIKLVDCVNLSEGETVLDVATGTAIVAIAASSLIGKKGKVIGVDISPVMLAQAREKIAKADVSNIELIESDIDDLEFPDNSFDTIFCSSSVPWFIDIPGVFDNWYRWLKPEGKIVFSCYSEKSFLTPKIVQLCQEMCNIELPDWNSITGTPEKCQQLLESSGFKNVVVKQEQLGHYLTAEEAKNTWKGDRIWINPRGNPLLDLSDEQLAQLKLAYDAEIDQLATEKRVWEDITIFYVYAYKLNHNNL
ncbi:Methyltransferase type 11 [Hyella patelloides LEGE 07179]|uniref:Methyltransferase type 11 n=1 Tax=Hyella patelloides LEGE 07179 TaxID=945734 RepID=A0A563W3H7_9CYAN|nr:methyltransferase domain-containing protein [Hyella patelloides]VEP18228.1 Methyltransferase type 11 [Hyella patelloides LEGE 07179]